LHPRVELLADDLLSPQARERATERLEEWIAHHITKTLAPLVTLQAELKKELPKEAPAGSATPAAVAPEDTAAVAQEADTTEAAAGDAAADASEDSEAPDAPESANAETPAAEVALYASPLQGVARGLAFQLYENLGSVSRQAVARELRAVQQADRAPLRRLGVRFGAFSIFLPALVKPAAARLKALLWAVHQGVSEIPPPPAAGLTSAPSDPTVSAGFYEAAGFRLCGPRAVRIDMLERVGEIIRAKGHGGQMPDSFVVSNDMMSVLGCGEDDLAQVLRSLGFRDMKSKNEAGEDVVRWQVRQRRDDRKPRPKTAKPRRAPAASAVPYGAPAEPAAQSAPSPSPEPKREKRRHERQDDKPRGARKEKPFAVDPDSPFAALAQLKFRK
jgi:ATP-dependent RNA helicase SUPV3L1/SUV3